MPTWLKDPPTLLLGELAPDLSPTPFRTFHGAPALLLPYFQACLHWLAEGGPHRHVRGWLRAGPCLGEGHCRQTR